MNTPQVGRCIRFVICLFLDDPCVFSCGAALLPALILRSGFLHSSKLFDITVPSSSDFNSSMGSNTCRSFVHRAQTLCSFFFYHLFREFTSSSLLFSSLLERTRLLAAPLVRAAPNDPYFYDNHIKINKLVFLS